MTYKLQIIYISREISVFRVKTNRRESLLLNKFVDCVKAISAVTTPDWKNFSIFCRFFLTRFSPLRYMILCIEMILY